MRVLVLTYKDIQAGLNSDHNGGGWIDGFIHEVSKQANVVLGVCCLGGGVWGKKYHSGIVSYPFLPKLDFFGKFKKLFSPSMEEEIALPYIKKAIDDFSPDIIHIFGSDNFMGVICGKTEVPCIIHIQGFLPAYENAKCPPGFCTKDFLPSFILHPIAHYRQRYFDKVFSYRAKREINILAHCNYIMGRTEWDHIISSIFAPRSEYWYCSEILRSVFYANKGKWHPHDRSKIVIVSVLSTPVYKGHDLILKTARFITKYLKCDFEWHTYGGGFTCKFEQKLCVKDKDVNVFQHGVVSADELVDILLTADIYVHPSYIDNSPNSVGEAQILGVPSIAVNAGGVSCLFPSTLNRWLVPANDPMVLAYRILELSKDTSLAANVSIMSSEVATQRHSPEKVVAATLKCYNSILNM